MSIGSLCMQRRKVYYGNNLFAKGACAAGKERLEDKIAEGVPLYESCSCAERCGNGNAGNGCTGVLPAYWRLGKNWYECRAGCELILDDITELVFVVGTFGEKHKKKVIMGLPGLPAKRPNRDYRLSLALAYVSQKKCRVVVKDLGFGEMFPSSGKVWDELVELAKEAGNERLYFMSDKKGGQAVFCGEY